MWGDYVKGKKINDYLCIISGTAFLAVSVEVFFLPSKISSGGISSIGTIFYYAFNVPLSVTNILFNILLFGLGIKYLDKKSLSKTVFGILSFGFFLELFSHITGYTDDILAATIFGGVTMGIGIGLVIRSGGSTGGSDFLGVILNKLIPHISVPKIIFMIDFFIIGISGLFFKSMTVVAYSSVALFLSLKVGDAVIYIGNKAKQIVIISNKSDIIASKILSSCNRGATGFFCQGMYSGEKRIAVMCVVSPREVQNVMSIVKTTDTDSFVIITDVKEVVGEGFKKKTN